MPSPILNVMIKAAEKAARGLKRDFNEVEHLQVSRKGPGDFVSIADQKAEETIRTELLKARPDFAFLGEEGGLQGTKEAVDRFIVDPLDGTSNFLHGLPHWCISIGYEHKGQMVAGVVYDPIKDELFHAEKGGGAFLNSRRLRVSGRKDISTACITTDFQTTSPETRHIWWEQARSFLEKGVNVRGFGSGALAMCYVAAGRAEGHFTHKLSPWDVAAGLVLIKEAGGHLTRLNGAKYALGTHDVLATNDAMHTSIVKLLKVDDAVSNSRKKAAG